MTSWSKVKLGDVCTFKYGKVPKKEDIIRHSDNPIFSGYRITGYCNHFMFEDPQLVVVARGVGGTGEVKISPPKAYITNLSIILNIDKHFTNMKYLYYYFMLNNLRHLDTGSVQSQITISDLKNLEITLPPLDEQKAIVDMLSCLDDKIENNNRINKNLEAQAQAIFKHWFIDFEFPNDYGKPYKSSGGEFITSELGLIPKGWAVEKLGDIADIVMGRSPDGKSYNTEGNGEVFYQGGAEFGWRFPTNRLFTNEPKKMAKNGSVLLSVRAPVGSINVAFEDCCVGRGLASLSSKNSYNSFLLYLLINLKDTFNIYNAEGTVFGSINKDTLNFIKVIAPPQLKIEKFENIVSIYDENIKNHFLQNQNLTAIRDTLLPKLISGKMRI